MGGDWKRDKKKNKTGNVIIWPSQHLFLLSAPIRGDMKSLYGPTYQPRGFGAWYRVVWELSWSDQLFLWPQAMRSEMTLSQSHRSQSVSSDFWASTGKMNTRSQFTEGTRPGWFLVTTMPVQFSSVTQSCPTLCDPMNRSLPGLPVHHQLPEFTQTHVHRVHDAIQPSHPGSSPSPPAPNPSQHQSVFRWVNSLHEVAKVLKFQL